MNLPPSCSTRGSQVLVAWPNLLSPRLAPMPLNWVWLKVLKDSARYSKAIAGAGRIDRVKA